MERRVEVMKYEKKDKVAFVTLDGSSDKLNALLQKLLHAYEQRVPFWVIL